MRVAAIVLVLVGGTARAESTEEGAGAEPQLITPTRGKPAAPATVRLSHKGQFQVSARLALGLRAITPYNDEYCGKTQQDTSNGFAPVCTGRAPLSLDFELGYGVGHRIDAFLELRLGLERDFPGTPTSTDGTQLVHVSPGARFFFSDAGRSKLFTTAQLVIDFSGYQDPAGAKLGTDIGVRNMSGLWVDLDKAYGFYVFVGETATVARWLRFELEAGVGIQGRYR